MGLAPIDFQKAADILNCDVAAVRAVAKIEAGPKGAWTTHNGARAPVILFEAHWFYRLSKGPWSRSHPWLSSKRWNRALYTRTGGVRVGPGKDRQHVRLEQAAALERDPALMSASYGLFQVMGFHWAKLGYPSLQDFINSMWRSEADHLDSFIRYINVFGLSDELRRRDWAAFAYGYNGEEFWRNNYDGRLAAAYKTFDKDPQFNLA